MKISAYDRCQALKRSAKYREDFQRYLIERGDATEGAFRLPTREPPKERETEEMAEEETEEAWKVVTGLTDAAIRLCGKWNIFYPVFPDETDCKDPIVKSQMAPPLTLLKPPSRWKEVDGFHWGSQDEPEYISHIDDRLVLSIDPNCSYTELEEAFSKYIRFWIEKSGSRKREGDLGMWEVYDLHKPIDGSQGMTFDEIRLELIGPPAFSNNNESTAADLERVKATFKRAEKAIAWVEEVADNPANLHFSDSFYTRLAKVDPHEKY